MHTNPSQDLLFNCSCFKNKEVVRQDEVDMAVTLVKELGDIKLNKKIIDTLEESLYSRFTYLINDLAFLYKPQIMIDDFDLYIKISNKIFLDSIYSWYFTTIDTGNDELNQIYEYMKTICTVQEAIYSSFIRSKFVQFIFGCVHYYNTFFKNSPVYDSLHFAICSGVPVAMIVPPLSPPSGPRSII